MKRKIWKIKQMYKSKCINKKYLKRKIDIIIITINITKHFFVIKQIIVYSTTFYCGIFI